MKIHKIAVIALLMVLAVSTVAAEEDDDIEAPPTPDLEIEQDSGEDVNESDESGDDSEDGETGFWEALEIILSALIPF